MKFGRLLFILAAIIGSGCRIPNGTQVQEREIARGMHNRIVIERCATKTVFMPLTAEGPQWHYASSRVWTYFLSDEGKRTELTFLRREGLYRRISVYPINELEDWIAIDSDTEGRAALLLFSNAKILDRMDIHYDSLPGNQPFKMGADGILTFQEKGIVRELFFGDRHIKAKNPEKEKPDA